MGLVWRASAPQGSAPEDMKSGSLLEQGKGDFYSLLSLFMWNGQVALVKL